MISVSAIFLLMMLPGLAVLAASFVVSYFESEPSTLARHFRNFCTESKHNSWKVDM